MYRSSLFRFKHVSKRTFNHISISSRPKTILQSKRFQSAWFSNFHWLHFVEVSGDFCLTSTRSVENTKKSFCVHATYIGHIFINIYGNIYRFYKILKGVAKKWLVFSIRYWIYIIFISIFVIFDIIFIFTENKFSND